ncbi:hypothetical protein P691DRAFT_804705 [Macrolepiota fuliginosa MF-IS2]|uniref:Uncharacterized protein n=1 Tax=Macrolepiota fuliginosa MF-IS2 TaxID=1400762 RepID=A0A9P6C029_9AGAR|nr:hypothetical protein P691DRAFT_804705 [Macrolepiota fuliginosa MF-IS2]
MDTHGFPPGYFVIRSVATNRLLDVKSDYVEDGTEVLLWPEKETSLVESFRDPDANNQVFFIDPSGALCSRASGHAIDVEDGRLVLRHRRPISYPYPNAYSHPLPKFQYNAQTGEITIHFSHDPTYPLSSPPSSPGTSMLRNRTSDLGLEIPAAAGNWRNKTHFLVSQPLRKPRTIIDDASEMITTAIVSPINFFSSAFGGKSAAKPEEVFDGNIDLKEEEVVEEERGEEGEVDNSPELERRVRVIGIPNGSEGELGDKALKRRKWMVSSLRRVNARTGT